MCSARCCGNYVFVARAVVHDDGLVVLSWTTESSDVCKECTKTEEIHGLLSLGDAYGALWFRLVPPYGGHLSALRSAIANAAFRLVSSPILTSFLRSLVTFPVTVRLSLKFFAEWVWAPLEWQKWLKMRGRLLGGTGLFLPPMDSVVAFVSCMSSMAIPAFMVVHP